MQFLALIYGDPDGQRDRTPEQQEAMYAEYGRFAEEQGRQGKLAGGAEAAAPADARTVRVRDGQPDVSDGPAVPAKEQLGGYFMLACGSICRAVPLSTRS